MIDFKGQAVIVTGAGRGLGRLYALELARGAPRLSSTTSAPQCTAKVPTQRWPTAS